MLMEKKFGLEHDVLTADKVDKLGNDLFWTIKSEEWLSPIDRNLD